MKMLPVKLSEFLQGIKNVFDSEFYGETYQVIAEITDVKIYYDKTYAFLKLIEKKGSAIVAETGAAIWSQHFGIIQAFQKTTGQSLNQNLELLLTVEVTFHIRYGMRISISGIDAAYTLGKLELQKEETLQKLHTENPNLIFYENNTYYSRNKFSKFPSVFQNIALITAANSDGRRDFLQELQNNALNMHYQVVEFNAQVQGEKGVNSILQQLKKIQTLQQNYSCFDAVCIVRGGGSNTDFSTFDNYEIAVQIAKMSLPVFTGIGHDRNTSIADLMACQYLKTPTKTAVFLHEHNAMYIGKIWDNYARILEHAKTTIQHENQFVFTYKDKLKLSCNYLLNNEKNKIQYMADKIQILNPKKILSRGFSIVYKNKQPIDSVNQLKSQDKVTVEFKDGKVEATIN